jgi:hypothetical protein
MTTGIVTLGVLVLGLLLQAEGGGDLGLPLGPGGVNMVRNDAGGMLTGSLVASRSNHSRRLGNPRSRRIRSST